MLIHISHRYLPLLVLALFTLTGCETMSMHISDSDTSGARINSAVKRAAEKAHRKINLEYLEKLYLRNKDKENAVLNYARALRQTGSPQKALEIILPLSEPAESSAALKTETAAIYLSAKDEKRAEEYARRVILAAPDHAAKAHYYLGLSLERQEKPEDAEAEFRKALSDWDKDDTDYIQPLSALALNLTMQGKLEESMQLLQEARKKDPDNLDIERNLRIATALYQSENDYKTPKPRQKPHLKNHDEK